MTDISYRTALIVGASPGISASVARGLATAGLRVGLAARNVEKLAALATEIGAETFAVDATEPAAVARLFEDATARLGEPEAMGKFALRGLAQSAARELGPKGVHVAHFVIDGAVRNARRPDPADRPDCTLDPDGIAQTYLDVLRQSRSAWSLEVELRPWLETF